MNEFLSQTYIVPRLIAWFNNLTAADRTVGATEVLLFKVKIYMTSDGVLSMTVNADPSLPASGQYYGEAVYMWGGQRGIVATADASSFVELSKTVEQSPIQVVMP